MSPLERDLSEIPRGNNDSRGEGLVPDAEPRFVQLLVEQWARQEAEAGEKPLASKTARFRHSNAGKCARLIAYKAVGVPASDPMDLSGINNVRIGTIIHEHWQQALHEGPHTAEVEVQVHTLDGDGAGHIDAVFELPDKVVAYELKTIGGFGYKAAIGKAGRSRPAEGPKSDHLLQAAINGLACDADEIVIGYLAKEAVSVNAAGKMPEVMRFAAEWTLTREQFVPLAERELARVRGVLDLVDEGTLAARKIPDLPPGAEIVDPSNGRWEQRSDGEIIDTGSYWGCGYCSHRTLCASTDAGRIPVESVVAITPKAVA